MNTTRILAISAVLACFLLYNASCTLVYSGCETDADCDTATGEICIKARDGASECGLPKDYCEEGATRPCESQFGVCQEMVSECHAGVWAACASSEICDGLDNDCNGRADDTIPGVGDACSDGVGICEANGLRYCTAAGQVVCNATASAPEAGSCDCEDDNCDGVVDDWTLTAVPAGTEQADTTHWSMTLAGDKRYAAFESIATPGAITVLDVETGTVLSSVSGRMPTLLPSETFGLALFYVTTDTDVSSAIHQDEVHVVSVNPVTGALGTPECVGCNDAPRTSAATGPVVHYDAVYAFCSVDVVSQCGDQIDNDGDTLADEHDPNCLGSPLGVSEAGDPTMTLCSDGIDNDKDGVVDLADAGCVDAADTTEASCGYLVAYIRQSRKIYATRVYERTLAVQPKSFGLLLNLPTENRDALQVKLDMLEESAGLAFLAFLRENTVAASNEIVLLATLATDRSQVTNSEVIATGLPAGADFDVAGTRNGEVIVTWTSFTGVSYERFRISQGTTSDFDVAAGPFVFTDANALSVSNPEIVPLCVSRGLVLYQGETDAGSYVDAFSFDTTTGDTVQGGASTAGIQPKLAIDSTGEVRWGALVPTIGDTLPAGTPVTPAMSILSCDP